MTKMTIIIQGSMIKLGLVRKKRMKKMTIIMQCSIIKLVLVRKKKENQVEKGKKMKTIQLTMQFDVNVKYNTNHGKSKYIYINPELLNSPIHTSSHVQYIRPSQMVFE